MRAKATLAITVAGLVGALATPASAEKVDRFYLGVGSTTSEHWADVALGAKASRFSRRQSPSSRQRIPGEKHLQQLEAIFSAGWFALRRRHRPGVKRIHQGFGSATATPTPLLSLYGTARNFRSILGIPLRTIGSPTRHSMASIRLSERHGAVQGVERQRQHRCA